jgi:hypothetical protein
MSLAGPIEQDLAQMADITGTTPTTIQTKYGIITILDNFNYTIWKSDIITVLGTMD